MSALSTTVIWGGGLQFQLNAAEFKNISIILYIFLEFNRQKKKK